MSTWPRRMLGRCALLPALLCPGCATAARALVVAIDELPPWSVVEKGRMGGAYTDIVRELGRRLGLVVDTIQCPPRRCLLMLEQGKADMGIGFKSTPSRRRYLHFLATPYRQRAADRVFYMLPDQGSEVRSYADLAPLRIGVKPGAEYFEQFDQDSALNKEGAHSMEANFRKLALGRVDAVIAPEDQGDAMLQRLGLRHRVVKAGYRQADPTARAIGVALQSPFAARIDEFESAMGQMARDGTLEVLVRRHVRDGTAVAGAVSAATFSGRILP
jgi:polar amino acid transport system substrate-binding protein